MGLRLLPTLVNHQHSRPTIAEGIHISKQLKPGRQQLSRDEVKNHQRERIFAALEAVMSTQGYVETSVADLIKGAGVSRQTFYELFDSKQDCFLASYARRQGLLGDVILAAAPANSPLDRFGAVLRTYLSVMATDPRLSRLYLIGVYTAGPEAIARRLELQQQFVDGIAIIFGARSKEDRFLCQTLVAAVSTLVTNALLADDPQVLLDLHQPLVGVAERLMSAR